MFDDVFDLLDTDTHSSLPAGSPLAGAGDVSTPTAWDDAHGWQEGTGAEPEALGAPVAGQPAIMPAEYGPVPVPGTVPHHEVFDPATFDGVGNPLEDARFYERQDGNSCAVCAQGMVHEALTGIPFDEAAWSSWAQEAGLYNPESGGTAPQALGDLLERQGIPVERAYGKDIQALVDALQANKKVIVALNAQEIHFPLRDASTGMPVDQSGPFGHAVWVTGIDQQPDGSFTVVMNDSGTGGRLFACDLQDFMNAWNDHGRLAVIAG